MKVYILSINGFKSIFSDKDLDIMLDDIKRSKETDVIEITIDHMEKQDLENPPQFEVY